MAFTGIGQITFPPPFGNPCTDLYDGGKHYAASLRNDRRQLLVKCHPGDREVGKHDLPNDTAQSVCLFKGERTICIGVTCTNDAGGRDHKLFDTGIALVGAAPPPAGGIPAETVALIKARYAALGEALGLLGQ